MALDVTEKRHWNVLCVNVECVKNVLPTSIQNLLSRIMQVLLWESWVQIMNFFLTPFPLNLIAFRHLLHHDHLQNASLDIICCAPVLSSSFAYFLPTERTSHPLCVVHKKELELYCVPCKGLVCVLCVTFEEGHKGHHYVPLEEYVDTCREELLQVIKLKSFKFIAHLFLKGTDLLRARHTQLMVSLLSIERVIADIEKVRGNPDAAIRLDSLCRFMMDLKITWKRYFPRLHKHWNRESKTC